MEIKEALANPKPLEKISELNYEDRFTLYEAFRHSEITIIKHFVDTSVANGVAKDKLLSGLLHLAVRHNNDIEIIMYLVENGADVNSIDEDSWSILCPAVNSKNDIEMIEHLVENDVDVNVKDNHSLSVLHTAVMYKNDIEIIKFLVEKGANVNAKDIHSLSVLHTAIKNKNGLEIIKYLVKHGADVNSVNTTTINSIEMAAADGLHHVLKYIIDEQNFTNKKTTARKIAAETGNEENYSVLMINDHANELREAVANKRLDIIKGMFDEIRVIDVDISLIYTAICNESVDIVEFLINKVVPSKLYLSVNENGEDILTVAKGQKNKRLLALVEQYTSTISKIIVSGSTTPSNDNNCIESLIGVGDNLVNIFDCDKFSGDGAHSTQGERQKDHGSKFMLGSILKILLIIYKRGHKCILSCENANFGIFDDFVLETDNSIFCIQFKSKDHSIGKQLKCLDKADLFPPPNWKSTYAVLDYYDSFFKNIGKFTENDKKIYLILWTNRPLESSLLDFVEEAFIEPVGKVHKFKTGVLEELINKSNKSNRRKLSNINSTPPHLFKTFEDNFYLALCKEDKTQLDDVNKSLIRELFDDRVCGEILGLLTGELSKWYKPVKDSRGNYITDESLKYYFDGIMHRIFKFKN